VTSSFPLFCFFEYIHPTFIQKPRLLSSLRRLQLILWPGPFFLRRPRSCRLNPLPGLAGWRASSGNLVSCQRCLGFGCFNWHWHLWRLKSLSPFFVIGHCGFPPPVTFQGCHKTPFRLNCTKGSRIQSLFPPLFSFVLRCDRFLKLPLQSPPRFWW